MVQVPRKLTRQVKTWYPKLCMLAPSFLLHIWFNRRQIFVALEMVFMMYIFLKNADDCVFFILILYVKSRKRQTITYFHCLKNSFPLDNSQNLCLFFFLAKMQKDWHALSNVFLCVCNVHKRFFAVMVVFHFRIDHISSPLGVLSLQFDWSDRGFFQLNGSSSRPGFVFLTKPVIWVMKCQWPSQWQQNFDHLFLSLFTIRKRKRLVQISLFLT